MTLGTLARYLIGDRTAILTLVRQRGALLVGALLVLSAGFAREYDGEDLWHEPWHLLLPFGASLTTSFFLFTLTVLLKTDTKSWVRDIYAEKLDRSLGDYPAFRSINYNQGVTLVSALESWPEGPAIAKRIERDFPSVVEQMIEHERAWRGYSPAIEGPIPGQLEREERVNALLERFKALIAR